MIRPPDTLLRGRSLAVLTVTFVATFVLRVWGIGSHFSMLGDQIRDWGIALGPFTGLPLVGTPTHLHGYALGPAFYWILWATRVTLGPWFDNLPHAGGIGQCLLQSAADVLLMGGVWYRTRSVWFAIATAILVATEPFDLHMTQVIWNPVIATVLAKAAVALVLLGWPSTSQLGVAVTTAVAWAAVHAHIGAIFVAAGVFCALLLDPLVRHQSRESLRNLLVVAGVVFALQIPYLAYQIGHRFGDSAMGAVTGSVMQVLGGGESARLTNSLSGYLGAVRFIGASPFHVPALTWILLGCAALLVVRYWNDPAVVSVTVLPQVLAIAGFALFLGALDSYYYLTLIPTVILMVAIAVASVLPVRGRDGVGIVLVAATLAAVPARVRAERTLPDLPEYGTLVRGARALAKRGQPLRAVRADMRLPPSTDPEFLYQILDGHLDRESPWVGVIMADGRVEYRSVAPPSR